MIQVLLLATMSVTGPPYQPMASAKNVSVRNRNTLVTAFAPASDARNMYAVKMPHASRYVPMIGSSADAGLTCVTNTALRSQKLIQKAPKIGRASCRERV